MLNDKINDVELPVLLLKKNIVGRKKNDSDVEVPEAARKLDFRIVSYLEITGLLLNDKMDNVHAPVVVLKKKNIGSKNNICDVEVHSVGIHDIEDPAVGLKKKIYTVDVQAGGMRNNMSHTAKKSNFTDE